ncbi:hypothetical protein [Marinobacter sp. NFXS9]|uniref:hypothetical protein n=1 Tax=Marinobacter sp. NFXS9 TaxID=2818433 RepID=UPI0032DFE02D
MKYLIPVFVLLFSISTQAMEVSCNDAKFYLKHADIVFVGTVIDRKSIKNKAGICWTAEQGKQCGSKVATFKIEELIKGNEANITTVFAGDGCYCVDPYLESGERYIVFATNSGDKAAYNSMNGCATQPYEQEVLKEIKSAQ